MSLWEEGAVTTMTKGGTILNKRCNIRQNHEGKIGLSSPKKLLLFALMKTY